MSILRKFFAALLSVILFFSLSSPNASAMTKEEFTPQIFTALGWTVPDKYLSDVQEYDISKRSATLLTLEAMGWEFVVRMYEQITLLPEFSERDALSSVVSAISPAFPANIRDAFEEPLSQEDVPILMEWLAKSKQGVSWKSYFSYEGTTLMLYKTGIGNPTGSANGDLVNGVNEPLFIAMITVDMQKMPCQIATAVMAGGKTLELARIAEENYGVVGGINGGYFAGAKPIGALRRQGHTDNAKFWPYRSAFGWNNEGEFVFIDGKEVSQIEGDGRFNKYTEILQAGPLLMKNGEFSPNVENIHENVMNKRHPRTVVGTDGSKVMWVVIDGRNNMHSIGATIQETRALCKKLGMKTALNLDGGGSTSLWWRGLTFSLPSNSKDAERPIPYAVLVFQQGYGVRQ